MRVPPFKVEYECTDERLAEFGVSKRIIELSRQPFNRPGGLDFDVQYALSVMDARENVALAALASNNPDVRHVWYPPCAAEPLMGFVRSN